MPDAGNTGEDRLSVGPQGRDVHVAFCDLLNTIAFLPVQLFYLQQPWRSHYPADHRELPDGALIAPFISLLVFKALTRAGLVQGCQIPHDHFRGTIRSKKSERSARILIRLPSVGKQVVLKAVLIAGGDSLLWMPRKGLRARGRKWSKING